MNKSNSAHRAGGVRPGLGPRWRWRASAEQARGWNLRFESAGTAVPAALVMESPTLLVAAAEEMCWQAAAEGWRARRPRRWRRHAYAAWRAQSSWLEQKRQRLSSMVADALTVH